MFLSLLLTAAASYGISVETMPSCGGTEKVYGRYYFSSNLICISSRYADTEELKEKALAHELVHAAQDCAAGGLASGDFARVYGRGAATTAAIEA